MRYGLVAIVLILAAATVGAQPQVYRWVDANGVVHFSDSRPNESENVEAETIVVPDLPTRFETVRPLADQTRESNFPEDDLTRPELQSLVMPTSGQTRECFAPSPIKESGGSLYELPAALPAPLTPEEVESLRKTLREMSGRWSGAETGFSCYGNPEREEKRTSDSDMVSEGRLQNPDDFTFDSTMSNFASNTVRREVIRIGLREDRLRVNNRYATLLFMSERVLAFGYREKVGGTFGEYYWRIASDPRRSLTIEHVAYHQGALSSTSRRALRPR